MVNERIAPIALVGLMGAGKSTVARLLAGRLGLTAVDLDAVLEGEAGATVVELFGVHGEEDFRDREQAALEQAVARGACVIACGGGIVLRSAARALLGTRCRTVWLEVSPDVAAARLRSEGEGRPLLGESEWASSLRDLLAARAGFYAEVAGSRVNTDDLAVEEVAARIADTLASPAARRAARCG